MALTCLVDSGVVTLGLGRPLALGPAGKIRLTREMWRGPDELANPFLPIFLFLLFYWPLLFRLLLLFHLFHLLRHLLLLPTFPFTHALMRILKCSWFDRLIHICRHILASFQAGDDRDPLQGSIPAGFLRGGEAEDGIERGGGGGGITWRTCGKCGEWRPRGSAPIHAIFHSNQFHRIRLVLLFLVWFFCFFFWVPFISFRVKLAAPD